MFLKYAVFFTYQFSGEENAEIVWTVNLGLKKLMVDDRDEEENNLQKMMNEKFGCSEYGMKLYDCFAKLWKLGIARCQSKNWF